MIHHCEQRTDEWKALRCGKLTASRMADVLDFNKNGKESAARKNYRTELVCETLTGIPSPSPYVTQEMKWGQEQEIFAREAYNLRHGVEVELIGFATHERIGRLGASPDGLVGQFGTVEIKCPTTAQHLAWLRYGAHEYKPQMLVAMACTGRRWCDFVSFDSRVPPALQLYTKRFIWDAAAIAELERKAEQFLGEVDAEVAELSQRGRKQFPSDDEDLTPKLEAMLAMLRKGGPQLVVPVAESMPEEWEARV